MTSILSGIAASVVLIQWWSRHVFMVSMETYFTYLPSKVHECIWTDRHDKIIQEVGLWGVWSSWSC